MGTMQPFLLQNQEGLSQVSRLQLEFLYGVHCPGSKPETSKTYFLQVYSMHCFHCRIKTQNLLRRYGNWESVTDRQTELMIRSLKPKTFLDTSRRNKYKK